MWLTRLINVLSDHNRLLLQNLNFVLHRLDFTLPLRLLNTISLEDLLNMQLVLLLNASHFLIMLASHIHDDLADLINKSFSL